MKDADAADDARYGKDRRGDELPAGLRGKRERLARLQEAKERLELAATAERLAQESKLAKRAEEEEQSGKKKPSRKPASPDAAVNHERKANPTDPASRIMKTRQGHVQGFNAQAIVTAGQCIVSAKSPNTRTTSTSWRQCWRRWRPPGGSRDRRSSPDAGRGCGLLA